METQAIKFLLQAEKAQKSKNLILAKELYFKSLALDPALANAHHNLAAIYLSEK